MPTRWLEWARTLQALAQNGLTYSDNHFDQERYTAVRRIASEMMAVCPETELAQIVDLFAGEVGAATPKVDVRAAVFMDDAILLVKERSDGLWTLPGGWADVNEPPSEAIEREVFEESGYRTRATKLLAFYDRDKHGHPPFPFRVYKLFFQCELVGGTATPSEETEAAAFLPELSRGRVMPAQISRMFEYYRHPDLPTDFD